MEEVDPLHLEEDDWKDILVRAMPEHCVHRMLDHGFDTEDGSLLETMNMFERFETADNLLGRNAQDPFDPKTSGRRSSAKTPPRVRPSSEPRRGR